MGQLLRFALVVGALPLALLIAVTFLSEGSPFRPFPGPIGGRPLAVAPEAAPALPPLAAAAAARP